LEETIGLLFLRFNSRLDLQQESQLRHADREMAIEKIK